MTAYVLTWDYKEQPDLDELAEILGRLSDGRIQLCTVETGSDDYAIVLSDQPLTAAQAREAYQSGWDRADG